MYSFGALWDEYEQLDFDVKRSKVKVMTGQMWHNTAHTFTPLYLFLAPCGLRGCKNRAYSVS